jgi:hypothetical protein
MQSLRLGEEIVGQRDVFREGQIICRDRERPGVVDRGVERELDSFDEVKGDGVLEPTRDRSVFRT